MGTAAVPRKLGAQLAAPSAGPTFAEVLAASVVTPGSADPAGAVTATPLPAASAAAAAPAASRPVVSTNAAPTAPVKTLTGKPTPAALAKGKPASNGAAAAAAAAPAPKQGGPTPKQGGPTPKQGGPTPKQGGPTPKQGGPTPKQSGPTPKQSGPTPKQSGPTPKQSGPTPKQSGPTPKQSGPTPKQSGPTPKQSGPTPKQSGLTPKQSDPTPKQSDPTPKQSGPTPKQSDSVPKLPPVPKPDAPKLDASNSKPGALPSNPAPSAKPLATVLSAGSSPLVTTKAVNSTGAAGNSTGAVGNSTAPAGNSTRSAGNSTETATTPAYAVGSRDCQYGQVKQLHACAVGYAQSAKIRGGQWPTSSLYEVETEDDTVVNGRPVEKSLRFALMNFPDGVIITFSRSMEIVLQSNLFLRSRVTIDGRGVHVRITNGSIVLQNVNDVIIHNIEVSGNPRGDLIPIYNSSRVWIDHCRLQDALTGTVDVARGSTDVTISNNYISSRGQTMQLGLSDTEEADKKMRVTIYRNWFNTSGSMQPLCRKGRCHVANNLYTHWSYYCLAARRGAQIRSEKNFFRPAPGSARLEVTPWYRGMPATDVWFDATVTIASFQDYLAGGATFNKTAYAGPTPIFTPPYALSLPRNPRQMASILRINCGPNSRTSPATISLYNTSSTWIDHCRFSNLSATLPAIELARNSTAVTISNNLFYGTLGTQTVTASASPASGTGSALHLGQSDGDGINRDMNVTVYRNWFQSLSAMQPMCRLGKCHVANNLYTNWTGSTVEARAAAQVLLQSNLFISGPDSVQVVANTTSVPPGVVAEAGSNTTNTTNTTNIIKASPGASAAVAGAGAGAAAAGAGANVTATAAGTATMGPTLNATQVFTPPYDLPLGDPNALLFVVFMKLNAGPHAN
ncbi:unnamed protein product [Closterium sp. NIES-64]|nr:unnamed protein product [Closterium sp. NIES-64]